MPTLDAEQLLSQQLDNDSRQSTIGSKIRMIPYFVCEELGLNSLLSCSRDIYLIIFIRMIRLVAFHGVQLILIIYLKELKFDDRLIGLFMTLTSFGDVVTSFLLSIVADNVGRRNIFMFSSLIMALTGIAFLFVRSHGALLIIAFIGIMTPGGDVGPFKSLESSSLASLVPYEKRSDIYAWYGFLAKVFASCGIVSAGYLILFAEESFGLSVIDSYRTIFIAYIFISIVMYISSWMLSPRIEWENEENFKDVLVETEEDEEEEVGLITGPVLPSASGSKATPDDDNNNDETTQLLSRHNSHSSRVSTASTTREIASSVLDRIRNTKLFPQLNKNSYITVLKLSLLFGLDAFASSFIGGSWQVYYILHKFKVQPAEVGTIFFVTGIIAGFMSLLGSALCKRIGPIATMVITHLPASILIAVLPIPRSLNVTFLVLILRSCVQSMDAAPKQVFLSAIVPPNERTSVIGWVNVVKTLCHTIGPSVAGYFLSWDKQWICFVLAGVLKVSYDLGIMATFMDMNRKQAYQ